MMIIVVNIPEEYTELIQKLLRDKIYKDQSVLVQLALEGTFRELIEVGVLQEGDKELLLKGMEKCDRHGKNGEGKLPDTNGN